MIVEQNELVYVLDDDEKTAQLINIKSPKSEVIIPRSIKYKTHEFIVNAIKEIPFSFEYNVKSITFDQNSEIRSINANAVNNIIENLVIPPSLCELQEGWCDQAFSLKKVTIMPHNNYFKKHENKLIIGKSNVNNEEYDILVFAERDVETITIPPSIKRISASAFADSKIKHIFIPPNVEEIGEKAFNCCSSLIKIEIPQDSKLRKIGNKAFSQTSIESFSIPPKVYYLNEVLSIFSPKLTKVTVMPDNKYFKSYDDKLILGKSDNKSAEYDVVVIASRNIKSVLIPPNIKKNASYAFSNSQIENIEIPFHVTHICEGAFKLCKNLKYVKFDSNSELQVIEKEAFSNTSIEHFFILPNVIEISEETFHSCNKLKSIQIPPDSKLQAINKFAFAGTSIENIYLPASISELDDSWHYYMPLLKKSHYNDTYISKKINEKSVEYDSLKYVSHNIKTASVPSNIKRIEQLAFSHCQAEYVFITRNVTVVCFESFYCCKDIHKIEFETGSNLHTIEQCAFQGSFIETLIIPSNIQNLDYCWCFNTPKLDKIIVCPNNEQNIILHDDKLLIGKTDIKSNEYDILLFVPRSIISVTIPSFIKVIGSSAFNESSIHNILIPKNVIKIGSMSFMNCSQLQYVDFPHDTQIEKICSHSFHQSTIKSFYIPSTVTYCAYDAFFICRKIQIIELSENLKDFSLEKIKTINDSVIIMVPHKL